MTAVTARTYGGPEVLAIENSRCRGRGGRGAGRGAGVVAQRPRLALPHGHAVRRAIDRSVCAARSGSSVAPTSQASSSLPARRHPVRGRRRGVRRGAGWRVRRVPRVERGQRSGDARGRVIRGRRSDPGRRADRGPGAAHPRRGRARRPGADQRAAGGVGHDGGADRQGARRARDRGVQYPQRRDGPSARRRRGDRLHDATTSSPAVHDSTWCSTTSATAHRRRSAACCTQVVGT